MAGELVGEHRYAAHQGDREQSDGSKGRSRSRAMTMSRPRPAPPSRRRAAANPRRAPCRWPRQIGTCSQSTASKVLLVVSRKCLQVMIFSGHVQFPSCHFCFAKQAAMACGSMASQAPASRSRVNPVAVIGPHHQDGWNGGHPDNRGVGGSGGQESLLRAPPWRKHHGHDFGTGTDLQGQRCDGDPARKQQYGCIEPRRPSRRDCFLAAPSRLDIERKLIPRKYSARDNSETRTSVI